MAELSQAIKSYRVRIIASSGQSERTVEAISTMDAYQQALTGYSPKTILYSLSVQPCHKNSNECLAA